jgi:Cu-processing system permease protein
MLSQLRAFILISLKGGIRDRVLHAILAVGLLLLLTTPVVAYFSMRQVVALALSYSLSVISLLGLLLTLFFSQGALAREIERRSVYTVCSLPLPRSRYLLGRYLGFAVLLFLALGILGLFSSCALYILVRLYPPSVPFSWGHFALALWFLYWTMLIIGGVSLVFSTVATSTFLPLALTVGIYFASYATEAVRFYIESAHGGASTAPMIKWLARAAYWILPNLSLFDLKSQTIYHLALNGKAMVLTQVYGIGYLGVLLVLASIAFTRREFL